MSKLARICTALPKVFWFAFLGYITLCIVLNVAGAPFIEYQSKWSLSTLGFIFLPLGLLMGGACCLVVHVAHLPANIHPFLKRHGFGLFVGVGTGALLVLQGLLVQGGYFKGEGIDWDIMTSFDEPLILSGYYSVNPNNYFLGGIFAIMNHLAPLFGITDTYAITVAGGCLCISASVCMSAFIARRIGGTACGVCTFLLLFVFVGLSPGMFYPYSDSYGILFPTAVLFFYVCCPHPAKWPLMVFASYLGYSIKPTVLAVLGAAALVSICRFVVKRVSTPRAHDGEANAPERTRKDALRFACAALGCLLAGALAVTTVASVQAQVGVPTYPDKRLVPAHYLMMGFNTKSDGMFSMDDRAHSFQFPTAQEMTEADLDVFRTRVRILGPAGVANLMVRKALNEYNNGDVFTMERGNVAVSTVIGTNQAVLDFYGIDSDPAKNADPEVARPSPWAYLAQALWFMVLIGIVLCFLRRRPTAPEMAMALALLLLSGFLLLFECSARYLFLYMPFYVILAVRGWQAFGHKALSWWNARCTTRTEAITPSGV